LVAPLGRVQRSESFELSFDSGRVSDDISADGWLFGQKAQLIFALLALILFDALEEFLHRSRQLEERMNALTFPRDPGAERATLPGRAFELFENSRGFGDRANGDQIATVALEQMGQDAIENRLGPIRMNRRIERFGRNIGTDQPGHGELQWFESDAIDINRNDADEFFIRVKQ